MSEKTRELTPELKQKIEDYKDQCIKDLFEGREYNNFDPKVGEEYIEKIYEVAGFKKPVVLWAHDPIDYKNKFVLIDKREQVKNDIYDLYKRKNNSRTKQSKNRELLDNIQSYLDNNLPSKKEISNTDVTSEYLFLCSTYHRVYLTWYKFIQDEFDINHEHRELLNWLYERSNNNIARCHFEEEFVLVLRMPKGVKRQDNGFHSLDGPAIHWGDSYKMYYINGRKVPNYLYEKAYNKTLTFDEFIELDNEDYKAGIITLYKERHGQDALMKFLGAVEVDSKEIKHSSGHTEVVSLYKTVDKFEFLADVDGNMNQPYAWLKLSCPSTGTIYLVDTSAHFTNALEACKFHRPQTIPRELEYDFKKFNN